MRKYSGALALAVAFIGLPAHAEVRLLDDEATVRRTGEVTVQLDTGVAKVPVTVWRKAGVTHAYGRDSSGRYLVLTDAGDGWTGSVQGASLSEGVGDVAAKAGTAAPGFVGDVMAPVARAAEGGLAVAAPKAADTRLDVLFLYTHRAAEVHGLEAIYKAGPLFESRMNATLANSGLPYTARVVGFAEVDVEDPTDVGLAQWYPKFMNDKGNSEISRSAFSADLVVVLRGPIEQHEVVAGVASGYSGQPFETERANAYTLIYTEHASTSGGTPVHEVGHLLGGGHESPERGWKNYSSAHSCSDGPALQGDPADWAPWATAVSSHASSVPLYSTPSYTAADGTACGDAATGDNVRTFRDSLPVVTSYNPRMPVYSTFTLPGASEISVQENVGTIPVEVTRSGDLSKAGSVEVATVPSGSRRAKAGADYVDVLKRVEFAAGEDRHTVQVQVLDNSWYDTGAATNGPKTFSIVLRYPVNADVANDEQVVSVIDNEIPAPTPTPRPSTGGSSGGGALGLPLLLPLLGLVGLRRRGFPWHP
ncbi:Calx-beta domain-containing protein [Sinimarinibacterium sp. CAU 1509]|uniref:Calx-beta domain-containing protein n=1 Tax=Sinimarinibacterium sp. CAU 1509 TaxID=2562283 RepID=UPI00146CF22A|nr:Calx-beta domain-containing protein [Sinimarinibacterium sp. CAU 1509]